MGALLLCAGVGGCDIGDDDGGGTRLPAVTFSAAPSLVAAGGTTTMTWEAARADSCVASGAWDGSVAVSGSVTLTLAEPGKQVFVLTCAGPGGDDTAVAEVMVMDAPTGPAPQIVFSAAPDAIQPDDDTTLTWSSTNADSCSASGAWSGPLGLSGNETVTLTESGEYVFVVTCFGNGGSDTAVAQVVVTGEVAEPAPVVALTADPAYLPVNASTTLAWTSSNADYCFASGAWSGTVPLSGDATLTMSEAGSHIFVLTCYGPGGHDTEAREVWVTGDGGGAGPNVSITADPEAVAVGATTTLDWESDGNACFASGAWSGNRATSGTQSVTVPYPGYNFFGLSCQNGAGTTYTGIYVEGIQAQVELDASADVVGAGQAVTLSWATEHATTCTASGAWSGAKAASGSELVSVPMGEQTYSLTCSDPGAPGTHTITVTGAATELTFSAYPHTVTAGETVTLYWDAAYADGCTASDGWSGARAAQGRETIVLATPGALQYTLTCDNAASSDAVTVDVAVATGPAAPPATTYRLNPRHDGYVAFAGGITLPATATPTWTRNFGTNVGPPVIADGRALAAPRNSDSSYGNRLYGLDLDTGDILWGPGAIPGVYWIDGGMAYEDGRLFAVTSDGLARAYDAATGIGIWSRQLPIYSVNSVPVVFGNVLFTSGAYAMYALDAESGDVLWSRAYLYNYAAPAVSSQGVYIGSHQCTALALHPLTGATLWTGETCGDDGHRYVLSGDLLYVTENSGNVRAYDAATGADAPGFMTTAQPIAASADVTLTMWSGALVATDKASGAQLWQFSGDGKLFTAPIIVNDVVFIGTSTSKLYAVDLATGTLLWTGTTSALASSSYYPVITAGEGWLIVSGNSQYAAWALQ